MSHYSRRSNVSAGGTTRKANTCAIKAQPSKEFSRVEAAPVMDIPKGKKRRILLGKGIKKRIKYVQI